MTELMPFPHQTAVKPHISQQWLERSRSKLERQGHGPALDNLWSSDTLALYPIVSDEACERMSADRRVLQQIKNKQNIKSRHLAFYEAGTACFWVLYGCVLMTAPAFARQLQDTCDRSTYTNPKPNQMDGGRAWRMIIARLCPPTLPQHMIDAYDSALATVKKYHLPDGCTGEQFETKAHGVLELILPNLERPLTPEQITKLLVKFLPINLKMEGNRLLKNIEAAGGLADHELVVRECVTLVTKYQAESAAGPVTYTMDPNSAEAAALMELAPTPVEITEITGAVFIFEREDSEPAPTDDTNPEPETDSCQSDWSAAEEYEEAAPEQDIECAAGAAVNMTQLEERLARFGDIVMLTAPCAIDEKSPDERANATVTIKPLQATGHACVPSLRHVSGGGDGIPTKDVTTTGDTTFGWYGKSDPSGDPTANGAGEQQQQRQSAHGTYTNGVKRATNTNGAIRAALASYAPPTAPYAPPSASYAPPTTTARGGLLMGLTLCAPHRHANRLRLAATSRHETAS